LRLLGERSARAGAELRRRAALIDALAHAHRLRILIALLNGPRSHLELAKSLNLRPGPLYFHLRVLERAGLIDRPTRNAYARTRRGEKLLLGLIGLTDRDATSRSQ